MEPKQVPAGGKTAGLLYHRVHPGSAPGQQPQPAYAHSAVARADSMTSVGRSLLDRRERLRHPEEKPEQHREREAEVEGVNHAVHHGGGHRRKEADG